MEICSYCEAYREGRLDEVNRIYHDTQYGFPIDNDDELFGRLILEINQAGLSWTTILKKQDGFREVYDGFSIQKIAAYDEQDFLRIKNDARIIRNTLKIRAAIHNAQEILKIQEESGSFLAWLEQNYKTDIKEWVKLFKSRFRFVGGEIVKEFLMSTGFYHGVHDELCHVYEETRRMSYWGNKD